MFIKIPIYFELTGKFNPDEVRLLTEAWQRELTKQIHSELKAWRKFKFDMDGNPCLLEIRSSESVRKDIVKPELAPAPIIKP